MTVDILPLGLPGSGKGTVAKILAERLSIPHVSTGDMLRALDRQSDLGSRVFARIDVGDFVSDELISEMVEERMILPDAKNGIILDGFPRTESQLPIYDALCARLGRTPLFVELKIPKKVATLRMQGRAEKENRADDTPEVIAHRLENYRVLTAPLVATLSLAGRLVVIDGDKTPDEVATAIEAARESLALPGMEL